jgi:5'-3' exonuclease
MTSKILILDAYNLIHIARSGFKLGDNPVVYNFMRGLKAHVNEHKPDRIVCVIEGNPKFKASLYPEYKANRIIDPANTKKLAELEVFNRQKNLIIETLKNDFPISVVQHIDYEADDTIANIVMSSSPEDELILLSSDTDFIQLLQTNSNFKLYNPIKKLFVEAPTHDYVTWKALRGDGSDNIPGLSGVGDKKAAKYAELDEASLRATFSNSDYELFERNLNLIKFPVWTAETTLEAKIWQGQLNLPNIQKLFEDCGFNSMLKDKYWNDFSNTFLILQK